MDLYKTITELHQELERLNRVIASLEEMASAGVETVAPHRGRKFVSGSERRAVSERMRKYWESRRRAG
jgi:hypothetical protein